MAALSTRPPAVAGLFYPADATQLRSDVRALLRAAATDAAPPPVKALIVPHAGFIYSGATAARAYARLAAQRGRIRRVLLLGPAHRVPVRGLALPGADCFDTPLGRVAIDREALARIAELPQVLRSEAAHAQEHALEVQLPFLIETLGEFTLLPLVVGDAEAHAVAEVLERLWGGDETLLVVSSDLSHYLDYASANQIDRDTCARILALEAGIDWDQACGATPVNGLLLAARRHGLQAQLLARCNSGDTAGDRRRVVGYAAFAFTAAAPVGEADTTLGEASLEHARAAIAEALRQPLPPPREHAGLDVATACFVTLKQSGELRGCIGTLQASAPLRCNLHRYARAAAFEDPRFPPLQRDELPRTQIEVSLLSPLEALPPCAEAEAIALLRPGRDGLVLDCDGRRGTFLPQVWEALPEPRDFLAELRRKAGLPRDFWSEAVRLSRYTVRHWQGPALPAEFAP